MSLQLCQDQEEERLEFVKGKLWDWANALSTVAMAEDESAERTRTALEQAEPAIDLKVFVRHSGTGNAIPDPPPFVDYALGGQPPKPTFMTAKFARSSTRSDAVKHSPSNIDDISRAFSSAQVGQRDKEEQKERERERGRQQEVVASQSRNSLAEAVSANSIANSQQYGSQAAIAGAAGAARQGPPHSSASAVGSAVGGGGRFAVSAGANLQTSADRPPRAPSPTGRAPASAFRRSPSQDALPSMGVVSPGPNGTPTGQGVQAPPVATAQPEEEEEDPLLQALNKLKLAQAQPRTPTRPHSSAPPLQTQQQYQPSPQAHRMAHQKSQASLGRVDPAYSGPPRAPSPGPQAQMMQPPRAASPNNLAQQGRPHSRSGSAVGQGAFAGVGAGARSPSPQPFQAQQYAPQSQGQVNGGQGTRGALQSPYQAGVPGGQGQQQYGQQGYSHQQQQQQQRAPSPSPSPMAFSPSRGGGGHQAYPSSGSAVGGFSPAPAPVQSPYGAPPVQQHQQQPSRAYAPSPAGQQQQYQHSPAGPYATPASAYAGSAVGGYAPSPVQAVQAASPAAYGHPGAGGSSYNPARIGSVGPASSLGGYGSPMAGSQAGLSQAYATSPAPQLQQPIQPHHQPQHARAPSPSPAPAPPPAPTVPPAGGYTDEGKPILFYVSAIYDYAPQSADEIRFAQGDVVAITHTSQDGWWEGCKVGQRVGGLLPSNFVELVQ